MTCLFMRYVVLSGEGTDGVCFRGHDLGTVFLNLVMAPVGVEEIWMGLLPMTVIP